MKTKEVMRRGCAVCAIVAVAGFYCLNGGYVKASTHMTAGGSFAGNSETQGDGYENNNEQMKKEQNMGDYIVKTRSQKDLSRIKRKYSESDKISENKQDFLEEKKIATVELSGMETAALEEDDTVVYVEEDATVEASAAIVKKGKEHIKEKKKHKMKENTHKRNTSSAEWNVRMIKADGNIKKKSDKKANRIKIAVLDSGIDWGNDINLAYQISLVPGEEEMTQIFMDGTGHGTSVASLIAADDDGDGITGINSNVDLYSYRVLDDANKAPISRVAEAIYMAIEQNVNIINMSFGLDTDSETLKEAVHAANEAGILVIAAAGNTGDAGVQYPAAYEDVMAVGAVNKDGLVESYSAKGEEVEIVAPGDLVRTTGFVGTEEVTSGTSLAAPQIAAVAALIWQKDPRVSADFVRGLLDESANLYGQTDEYGNGLLDAEYALSHYDEYKSRYKETGEKTKQLIPENKGEIITFDDTGCIKGCWTQNVHEGMVGDTSKFCVRAGARFPDFEGKKTFTYGGTSYEFNLGSNTNGKDTRKFAGMTKNPWWHGYHKTNYIKAVIYATRMADAIKKSGKYTDASNSINYADADSMKESIKLLYDNSEKGWKYILSYIKGNNAGNTSAQNQGNTKGFKRAVVWGMALHSATDTYAHSTNDRNGQITHAGGYADNEKYIAARYYDAVSVARQIMNRYNNDGSLTARDLKVPGYYTIGYELIEYGSYMCEVDSSMTGYAYSFGTK